ncbi:phospho-N-acetylmuramoyl-pentapeptide-transferase [Ranunculus cassubicifolius]
MNPNWLISNSISTTLNHYMCYSIHLQSNLGFFKTLTLHQSRCRNRYNLELCRSQFRRGKCHRRTNFVPIKAMDEFSDGFSSFDEKEWDDDERTNGVNSYILSSRGDESDMDVVYTPIGDVDVASTNEEFESSDGDLDVTARRMSVLQTKGKRKRIQPGNIINRGLIAFLLILLLLVDWCSWWIVRLPLSRFHLSHPFIISAVLTSIAGYLCVPILKHMNILQIIKKEGPHMHYSKKGTPTMGGLYFVPVGVSVAVFIAGISSQEVLGAATATLAFAFIGIFDDFYGFINNCNHGLPAWMKLVLEVVVGSCFWFWLQSAKISSPYSMYSFL